jgi:hypothetical protein
MFLKLKEYVSQNEYPMRIRRVRMKYLLTICLLLISTPSIVSAQQRGKLNRAETNADSPKWATGQARSTDYLILRLVRP